MARRWGVVAALLAVLATVGLNGATAATVALAKGTRTWTQGIASGGKTTSIGTATWGPVSAPSMNLSITTGTLAAGKCATVFFDWTSKGHHDSRAIRDCRSNDTLTQVFAEPLPTNITGGPQKLGVCYGEDDRRGTCTQIGTGGIEFTWSVWPELTRTTPCDLSWVHEAADGTRTEFFDPHPQAATLSAPGLC